MRKTAIFGLGRAGVRAVDALSRMPAAAPLQLLAIDTDARELESCSLAPEKKLLCDLQWCAGGGTGGDVMKGQRALARERTRLSELLQGVELLIVLGGLGGGTATGGAGVLAGVAKAQNIPQIFLLTLPFSFEGHGRSKRADAGIRELLPVADTLLTLPNDLLFSALLPAETPAGEAFAMADLELARCVIGLIGVFGGDNLLAADLGDLAALLRARKNYCAIGVGRSEAVETGSAAQESLMRLLDSPFLGGASKLREADAVLLNLTGGSTLSLGELRRTLDAASEFLGTEAQVLIGANILPEFGRETQLTAVCIKFDERAEIDQTVETARSAKRRKPKPQEPVQPTQLALPFPILTSGIFEGRTETIENGVKLDIPTFLREELTIDPGD